MNKTKFLFTLIIAIILISCKEKVTNNCPLNNGYLLSEGIIYGFDTRKCMCCGGWEIDINGDSLRIFESIPGFDSTISTKELPVKVQVSWKKITDGCGSTFANLIEINSFELK